MKTEGTNKNKKHAMPYACPEEAPAMQKYQRSAPSMAVPLPCQCLGHAEASRGSPCKLKQPTAPRDLKVPKTKTYLIFRFGNDTSIQGHLHL